MIGKKRDFVLAARVIGPELSGHRGAAADAKLGQSPHSRQGPHIDIAWWVSFYPGLAILIPVLGYNLLGESIRGSLDPRLR